MSGVQEPPPIPVILLGNEFFVYTDQDWSRFPGLASEVLAATSKVFWLYWGHLLSGIPFVEAGGIIRPRYLWARCLELHAGTLLMKRHIAITYRH